MKLNESIIKNLKESSYTNKDLYNMMQSIFSSDKLSIRKAGPTPGYIISGSTNNVTLDTRTSFGEEVFGLKIFGNKFSNTIKDRVKTKFSLSEENDMLIVNDSAAEDVFNYIKEELEKEPNKHEQEVMSSKAAKDFYKKYIKNENEAFKKTLAILLSYDVEL